MDMMGAMMGAGGQGSKYKPKTEESIPDKYEAMLAKDDIAPAHRATLEKMALRRKQRETKQEEDRAAALEASLTPAHRAAMASDAAALKQLDHSLLSARSTVGQTAAHLAAQAGAVECLEVVRALGPAGEALLAEPDDAGDTPAHLAAAAGSADALRFLHTCEAFPPAGPRTHSVLHAAVKGNSPVAVAALGKLLPAAATQVVDADDNTPAHLAAKLGHHECLKSVVGIGGPACVAVRHANGAAPPHDAAFYGHAACISVLLAALPSCAGWCDDDGDTPLHAAAARGHEEVLAELLAAAAGCAEDNALCGAASRNNTKNESPMTLAGMAGHTGCVEQLEQHAARIDGAAAPLHVVAEHMKAEGNLLTKIGDFSRAASSYERAIALYSPPADLPPSADASQTEGASQPPTLANADMASVLDDRPGRSTRCVCQLSSSCVVCLPVPKTRRSTRAAIRRPRNRSRATVEPLLLADPCAANSG
jgi:ankyrin repeat protein